MDSSLVMHPDEVPIDADLVGRLLEGQFPAWAGLPLEGVPSAGTDNALYRLGDRLLVRLPRRPSSAPQTEKEAAWLPRLAPHLPLAVPVPLALGAPACGYPWSWSVVPWIQGENPTVGALLDPRSLALDIATFVSSMHAIALGGGPPAGEHNFGRGVPLAERDERVWATVEELRGEIDADAVVAAWERAVEASTWDADPVWVHGDVAPGNLLAVDGRLVGVIDFGCLGVGDPAVDLIPAWNLLPRDAREVFRSAVGVDGATWTRGRGWALSIALFQLPYYRDTNPTLVANSRYVINEVLAD